ncbi:orotidine-5'-phosphate decarboxylase [Laceyella tengchongensis]|uniref:orotidine-5'-phosphate decarboxylase n=1 Tax=Laceyella tengchongensis TaxID=574699 RepID=UPI0012B899B7|nr:orotidine-5'-phosphate decarboxylase [Laceyella tengchongensis]
MVVDERIFIALDYPGANEAERLLARWAGTAKPAIKVGYQLFYAVGPQWVAARKEEGYTVFLDLKLHDIPNTVAKGVESLSSLGVDFLTLHASGGRAMIAAAREMAEKKSGAGGRMRLLSVTQLTSTDQAIMNQEIGIPGTVKESVTHYAKLAYEAGADGVICSAHEAGDVKAVTGSHFLAVTPGIRPAGVNADDQKRIMTPSGAIQRGADYLVVGRAITTAADPKRAYEAILAEINQG